MRLKGLVLIEWEDSTQPQGAWKWLHACDEGRAAVCQSVGWLVHDDDEVKALAPNRAQLEGEIQVSAIIRIPTRAIRKITPLGTAGRARRVLASLSFLATLLLGG